MTTGRSEPPVGSVARVVEVLKAVADWGSEGSRLIEVTRETGLPRPTAHRILRELIDTGMVIQSPERRYRLGSAAFMMGTGWLHPVEHLAEVRDVIQQLAERSTMTTFLGVLLHRRVYYLARGQGSSPVHINSVRVGETRALTATHAGIALLDMLPTAMQDSVFGGSGRDGEPVCDPRRMLEIRRCVNDIRTRGYFYGHDITIPGVAGMAVLVPSAEGAPHMAVTIAALNEYLTPERAERLSKDLVAAADRVAAVLAAGR